MKKILLSFLFVIEIFTANAQVGINNTNPDASSALDITSTNSGILIPRMTKVQRDAITAPATGLMVFQTDNTPGFYYFEGTWKPFAGESHWVAEGDNIYNGNTGNVGVGTTNPTTKLHIENVGSPTVILNKDFETGGLAPLTTSGNQNWAIQTVNAYGGTKSAKSGAIGNNQESNLQYDVTILGGDATLSFYYKVSSEANYDKLIFTINGIEKGVWSGNVGYSQFTQVLTPGIYTLVWKYKKDVSGISGLDAAFLDNINIISASLEPALKLVDGNQAAGKVLVSDALGNATWQALSNETIVDIPLIAAFGGMKIPPCGPAYDYQTDFFYIDIKGVETKVTWMIYERTTTANSTVNINGDNVLKAPYKAERLQVNYVFDPPLPFEPNGIIFSASNDSSSWSDAFTLNYVQKSQNNIRMNIVRTDKIGDTTSPCWTYGSTFDVFMTN